VLYNNTRNFKEIRMQRDRELLREYTHVTEFLNEIYPLDENYKASFRKDIIDFVFLQNIDRFKKIEKEIQEGFDTSFNMDQETLNQILYAMIKRILTKSIIDYDNHKISNIEKNILDITKRFLIYSRMYNHETLLII
jgi:hypothetical protein